MVAMFALCVAAAILFASGSLLRPVDIAGHAPPARRIAELDGLRGLLALAVLLHHAALYPDWLQTGTWRLAGSFDAVLGEGGVAMFFMITGYLFWRRLLVRRGNVEWGSLYLGRLFRIGPLYLAAAMVAITVSLLETSQLNVPWVTLGSQVARALAFGAFTMPDVNGYHASMLLAGVTWSLRYEWLFYAGLPLLALVARRKRPLLWAASTLLALLTLLSSGRADAIAGDQKFACYATEFGFGILACSLHNAHAARPWRRLAVHPLGSMLATACLVITAASFGTAQALLPILLLGAAFCLIANGANLFGLLTLRPMGRLGDVSYGLYLLHGLVLALLFRPPALRAIVLSGPAGFAVMTLLATLLSVLVAAAAYVLIEQPGQRLGRRLDARLRTHAGHIAIEEALGSP